MRYDLAQMARRSGNRPRRVVFRDIVPPRMFANDLYNAVYAPVLAEWAKSAPSIVAEYASTIGAMTRDAPADIEAKITGAETSLDRLFLILRPATGKMVLKVEAWFRGKWRGAALSATGVDIATLIGPEDVRTTIGAAIETNVALVKDVSAEVRRKISGSVYRGLNERRPAEYVAREIREALKTSRARSIRIAGDQIVKISSALAEERRREAGVDKWQWRHSEKARPRPEHLARNGKVYNDKTAPDDKPGQLPFCGCRQLPVIDI